MGDWEIVVIEGEPTRVWRSANAEAAALAHVGVPVLIAARWRRVRLEMTVGLSKRVKEDRN